MCVRGHTSFVYPVAFSPDGRWFASGGWDNGRPPLGRRQHRADRRPFRPQGVRRQPGHQPGWNSPRRPFVGWRLRIWDMRTGALLNDLEDGGLLELGTIQ